MSTEENSKPSTRASEYLRVSSDQQEYSIETQRATIAAFAADQQIEIIESYIDVGKSGLSLKGRDGLQNLLHDVMSPGRRFDTILVYDVSRWGRFQDPDQAAHYEFLCRQAGVEVIYCAEPFGNCDLLTTSVLKGLKRVMAAEYSRELSTKIYAAHLRGAQQGRWEGGSPPYGLRRQLVDENDNPIDVLEQGQRKASKVHRCKLIWGPDAEIRTIRRIFSSYVERRWPPARIAEVLNDEDLHTKLGGRWTAASIRAVLIQRLYIGIQTYNRVSQKLKGKRQINASAEWIQVKVIDPIISPRVFGKATIRLREGWRVYTPESLLDGLRDLLKIHGHLSWELIRNAESVPNPVTYNRYFGGLKPAFALIGYEARHLPGDGSKRLTKAQVFRRLKALRRKQGFLSQFTIDAAPNLPSASVVARMFGSLRRCYSAIGFDLSRADIMRAAYERKRLRGPIDRPRPTAFPKDMQLKGLHRLLGTYGRLDRRLIAADPDLPSIQTVARTFGSLTAAYNLVGAVRLRRGVWVVADAARAME